MKCFVISPIGQPGSSVREHADDVFECVIAPALNEAQVDGRRADHVKDVGRITQQMFDDLLSSDFCIAVLHDFNPNVFYEIAIAHSAGTPVILLCEKGIDPPFDLKDERAFHYDLSPRAIHNKTNVVGLVEMIDSVRKLEGARVVPFGDNLTPLNGELSRPPVAIRKETTASGEFWLDLVSGSTETLFLAGVSFNGWKGIQGMKEALRDAGKRGCDVRILTMDVDNPSFGSFLNPDVASHNLDGLREAVSEARDWFNSALTDAAKAEVRSLSRGSLNQQMIFGDDQCIVSPYLYSANTSRSPCIDITRESDIYNTFRHEFTSLWDNNDRLS